jgi:hypothetical protein
VCFHSFGLTKAADGIDVVGRVRAIDMHKDATQPAKAVASWELDLISLPVSLDMRADWHDGRREG